MLSVKIQAQIYNRAEKSCWNHFILWGLLSFDTLIRNNMRPVCAAYTSMLERKENLFHFSSSLASDIWALPPEPILMAP